MSPVAVLIVSAKSFVLVSTVFSKLLMSSFNSAALFSILPTIPLKADICCAPSNVLASAASSRAPIYAISVLETEFASTFVSISFSLDTSS